jgi:glycosyltransferase involved in cell wall biosynthesis
MKISVICANLNHGQFIERSINSVLCQSYKNWELLIADGGSSDNSIKIIKSFDDPRIKLLPGGDSGPQEAFAKAVSFAAGDAIMTTTSTDGYVDLDWFRCAISTLEANENISLVWGGWTQMHNGLLSFAIGPQPSRFSENPIDLFTNWIKSNNIERSFLPELNYCVRSNVFKSCLRTQPNFPLMDQLLLFHFNFMRDGYLTKFVPTIANFGREHENQEQNKSIQQDYLAWYSSLLASYRELVISKQIIHKFRDPSGRVITEVRF